MTIRPASLFAFAFFKEAAAIADPILDPLDRLLEDPELVALSAQALAKRSPGSNKAGPRRHCSGSAVALCRAQAHQRLVVSQTSPRNCEPACCIDASRAFMRIRFQILAIYVGLLPSLAKKALSRSTSGSCNRPKRQPSLPETDCAPTPPP
jgi:hypothetical protein